MFTTTNQEAISLFLCLAQSQLKKRRHGGQKDSAGRPKASKQLVRRLSCNIYSQQNWTYLDPRFKTGQICKIMQIWIFASMFIFLGFGTFRMKFTFCVERWVGEGPNSRGGCKFLYHPNVRSAEPQCAANCLQIYLSCSASVIVIVISW